MAHARTTIEHLGEDATDLDVGVYQLACAIRHAQILQLGYADEGCDCDEYVWNNGAWTEITEQLIRGAFESLGWGDQATANKWLGGIA